jgi:CRP-like cAMP-binding protein
MTKIDIERISDLPLFQQLTPAEVEIILQNSRSRRVEEGGYYFYQEDPATHIYLLSEGKVKLSQLTPDGQQVILNVVGAWEAFGLVAIVDSATYPVSAQAAADSAALSWDHDTLKSLASRYPTLALNAMTWMASRVHDFQSRIRELSTQRVEQRLARALLRLVRQVGRKTETGVLIDLPITRQDLAEMTGTTLYTVSRILSQWERQGLVDTGRERVVIRFPHGLVRIAEDLPANASPAGNEKKGSP